MAVTSHVYPKAVQALLNKTIDLSADSLGVLLCTGSAATWGATQEAYQYVSDVTAAYTECTDTDYARQSLAGLSVTVSGNKVVFTCTSPISFGSAVTISAASMAVYDTTVGTGDTTNPVIAIVDFGGTVSSTSGPWTYTVDSANGLAAFTCS